MRQIFKGAAMGGLMLCGLFSGASAQQASPFPDGPGRDIVATACTQCHAPGPIVQLRMNDAGWRKQVYNMILRGAQIGPGDIDATVAYLTASFGPGVAFPNTPKVDVKLADGAAANLVEGGCGLCHGLDRVVATKRDPHQWDAVVARMISVGAPFDADQAKQIVAYLGQNYGAQVEATAK